jgi:hypothetical protein
LPATYLIHLFANHSRQHNRAQVIIPRLACARSSLCRLKTCASCRETTRSILPTAGEIEKFHQEFEFLAVLDEFNQPFFERPRSGVCDECVGGYDF